MRLAYQVATPEVHTPDVTAHRGDLREGMRLLADAGFEGVELMMRDAAPNDADAVAALAREHGLAVAMCCTGEVFGEDRLCFADPDPAIREAALARARGILEFAGRLGVDINIGRLRGRLRDDVPRETTLGWARDAFLACADLAARLGIHVLLEPLPPGRPPTTDHRPPSGDAAMRSSVVGRRSSSSGNFLNTTREAVAFIEGLGHPHFRLMLDIGHMAANGDDVAESFQHAQLYNRYVHLTDDRRLPPGTGSVDFAAVLTALRAADYKGWIAVEVLQQPDSPTAIRQSAAVLRPLVSGSAAKGGIAS
jgi:sugar phosphate isomerase/epimerase